MPTDRLPWERRLGATPIAGGRVEFRCWAPAADDVKLRLNGTDHPMEDAGLGVREATVQAAAGDDYELVLDAFAGAPAAPADDAGLDQLTPREREILQHIARGYLYKEIAQRLGISVKTVEAHVSAVLRKLQLSTRHELSRWAMERRLVD